MDYQKPPEVLIGGFCNLCIEPGCLFPLVAKLLCKAMLTASFLGYHFMRVVVISFQPYKVQCPKLLTTKLHVARLQFVKKKKKRGEDGFFSWKSPRKVINMER